MRVLSRQLATRSEVSYFSRLREGLPAFPTFEIVHFAGGSLPRRRTLTRIRRHYRARGDVGQRTCLGEAEIPYSKTLSW